MAEGRTTYWKKDSAWHRRERIEILGIEFGPAGPLVIDWLSCEADTQRDRGRVRTGATAIAKGCHIPDVDQVRQIIHRALEIGALDDYAPEGVIFTVRVSGWAKDQERAAAAERQAAHRARLSRSVTDRDGESRPITPVTPPAGSDPEPAPGAPAALAVVQPPENPDNNNPANGAAGNRGTSAALSRSVTTRNAQSRPVTRSHVKPNPDQLTETPPSPPKGGNGRRRDRDREQREYETALDSYLVAHPCTASSDELDEWQTILGQLPVSAATFLAGSHPHLSTVAGALLIGVHHHSLSWLTQRLERSPGYFDAFTSGRRVTFLPCPQLERTAA